MRSRARMPERGFHRLWRSGLERHRRPPFDGVVAWRPPPGRCLLHGGGRRIHPPPDDDGLAEDDDRVDESPDVCPLRALLFARIVWSFMRMRMTFHANGFQAASVVFGAWDIPIGWRMRLRGAKEKPLAGGADCHRRPKQRPSYAMQTFPPESILRAFSASRLSKALSHRSSPSEAISSTMHPLLRQRDEE